MIGVEVRFLAGRFHGTSWHHAHNEGVPEWPPSPWRILRALVSAAYADGVPHSDFEPVLERLRALPRYRLPLAIDAHTRHYMPDVDAANHTRSKVFDAFVAVDGGARSPQPVIVGWPGELEDSERVLLLKLLRRISYLGRAESWAELRLVEVEEGDWDCWPDETTITSHSTTLLALAPQDELARWADGQPPPTKRQRDVPRRLLDVLTFDGERYRDEGWSEVPGTLRARYVFARPQFRRAAIPRAARRSPPRPTIARYAIRSPVLPRIQDALAIGERLRVSLMSQSRWVSGDARPVFSGHSEAVSNHEHAMYLATSEQPGAEGAITHLTVAARRGFDEADVLALQRLRRLWGRDGHDLELILIGLGDAADYGGTLPPRSPILAEATVWESMTPFVPVRHPKVRGGRVVDGIADQIRRVSEQVLGISPIEISAYGDAAEWLRFRRRRRAGGGRKGLDRAYGARLVFPKPVCGPIALGYGAHFGLGVFAAIR